MEFWGIYMEKRFFSSFFILIFSFPE